MPIEYTIDHDRCLVLAKGRGVVAHNDVIEYQRTVWSRRDVAGYNELVDMTEAERIVMPSREQVQQTAVMSAGMDPPSRPSRFAIVAPTDLAFGLGRMYQTYRSLEDKSTKEVGVFRRLEDALVFLGIEGNPFVAASKN